MEVTRTLLNKASEFLLGATSSVGDNHIVMCMEELTLEILRTDGRVMEMETQRPSRRTPLHHTHGDLTCLAPHERLSELPVVPREKSDTGAAREAP